MNILKKISEFLVNKRLSDEKLRMSFNIKLNEIKKRNKHKVIYSEIIPLILRKQYKKMGYFDMNEETINEANNFFLECKKEGIIDELNCIRSN